METAYAQVGHFNTPVHLRSALTKCSHHLFLLHIFLIDPLLTELSPKTTDDGLPTDCVGLCTACLWLFRTDLDPASTAPRLPRLSPVHTQYRFLPRHLCTYLFTHICTSFSSSFCSLFCTCHRSRLCTQVIPSVPARFQFSIFNLKRVCVCTLSVWRERGREGTLDGSVLGCAALCLCRNFKFGTPTPHVMPR